MRNSASLFVHVVHLITMRKPVIGLFPRVVKYNSSPLLHLSLLTVFPRSNIETLFIDYG